MQTGRDPAGTTRLGGSVSLGLTYTTARYAMRADIRVARHLSTMKVRDVLRLLADDGWVLDRTRGSHRQLKHPTKPGLVTIAGSGSDDLARGTLMSILKQAGLRNREQE